MATLKTCFKCGEEKPIMEFYRHPAMADGHLGKCKECAKMDVRANRAANADYYREYEALREERPERKAQKAALLLRMRARWPDRNAARGAVSSALKSGRICKLPCWVCGSDNVHAHHPDYDSPLDVVWLCVKHHREAHDLVLSA